MNRYRNVQCVLLILTIKMSMLCDLVKDVGLVWKLLKSKTCYFQFSLFWSCSIFCSGTRCQRFLGMFMFVIPPASVWHICTEAALTAAPYWICTSLLLMEDVPAWTEQMECGTEITQRNQSSLSIKNLDISLLKIGQKRHYLKLTRHQCAKNRVKLIKWYSLSLIFWTAPIWFLKSCGGWNKAAIHIQSYSASNIKRIKTKPAKT